MAAKFTISRMLTEHMDLTMSCQPILCGLQDVLIGSLYSDLSQPNPPIQVKESVMQPPELFQVGHHNLAIFTLILIWFW